MAGVAPRRGRSPLGRAILWVADTVEARAGRRRRAPFGAALLPPHPQASLPTGPALGEGGEGVERARSFRSRRQGLRAEARPLSGIRRTYILPRPGASQRGSPPGSRPGAAASLPWAGPQLGGENPLREMGVVGVIAEAGVLGSQCRTRQPKINTACFFVSE